MFVQGPFCVKKQRLCVKQKMYFFKVKGIFPKWNLGDFEKSTHLVYLLSFASYYSNTRTHTWYLSFFLHGHYIWLKFSPTKARIAPNQILRQNSVNRQKKPTNLATKQFKMQQNTINGNHIEGDFRFLHRYFLHRHRPWVRVKCQVCCTASQTHPSPFANNFAFILKFNHLQGNIRFFLKKNLTRNDFLFLKISKISINM